MAAGIEVAVLPPAIWVASVADFPQDLSAPDLVLSSGVEWVVAGYSHWEMNCCVLLSMLTMVITTPPLGPPGYLCVAR